MLSSAVRYSSSLGVSPWHLGSILSSQSGGCALEVLNIPLVLPLLISQRPWRVLLGTVYETYHIKGPLLTFGKGGVVTRGAAMLMCEYKIEGNGSFLRLK